MREVREEGRDNADGYERRAHHAQRGNNPAKDSALAISHKGRGIDGHDPGGYLPHTEAGEHIVAAHPLAPFNDLPLNEREHRITAAHCGGADLEKGKKDIAQSGQSGLPAFLWVANAQVKVIQLLLVDDTGGIIHGAHRERVLREGDDFLDRGLARHNHDQAVKAGGDTTVGRGAVLEGLGKEAKAFLCVGGIEAPILKMRFCRSGS